MEPFFVRVSGETHVHPLSVKLAEEKESLCQKQMLRCPPEIPASWTLLPEKLLGRPCRHCVELGREVEIWEYTLHFPI